MSNNLANVSTTDFKAQRVFAKLLDGISGTVFTLGDDAYPNGSATDFANCYAPTWGRPTARTMPAPGNHEYQTAGAAGYFGYFGSAAGDPTQGYYSYNLCDWHIAPGVIHYPTALHAWASRMGTGTYPPTPRPHSAIRPH